MQESRRRRRLEFDLLPLVLSVVTACAPASEPPKNAGGLSPASAVTEARPEPEAPATAGPSGVSAPEASRSAVQGPEPVEQPPAAPPEGTLILHIGDSFAAALGIPLGKRFKQAGMRSALEFKTASYIPTWAFGEELPKFVRRYNPDLVLITLGGNEIEIVNPEQRAGAVQRLIQRLEGRPCVWIAPPLWKPDTGVLEVIHHNAAPCRFLDTNSLISEMERGPDKIHPSTPAREAWADVVYAWLVRERAGDGDRPWALRPER
jgi:hypothetical protein